jgi:alpha-tubulin suppressor-like RCC1 family protein
MPAALGPRVELDDPDMTHLAEPVLLPMYWKQPVIKIVCGLRHCVLLTQQGAAYAFGNGANCVLGKPAEYCYAPVLIAIASGNPPWSLCPGLPPPSMLRAPR